MEYSRMSCYDFVEALSSKDPVPGGGGASALAGAVGIALGNMVGSLTVGKKKYADVEAEMYELKARCDRLQAELLAMMERDAEVFAPLARAYRMSSDTEEEKRQKEEVMQTALKDASLVPVRIMEKCCEALDILEQFAGKGSVMAISDAGVGAALCRAALQGASLNVFINTKAMTDRKLAGQLNDQANAMLEKYLPAAEAIVEGVAARLA